MNIVNDIVEQSDSIEEITFIDSETFKKDYFKKNKPVLIKGLAKNWGATENWNFDFFLGLNEDKEILLLSDNFIQGDNRYKKSSFKKYIKKLKDAELNDEPAKDYLTTLDIFNYFPHLTADIDFSLFEKQTRTNDVTAWVGPKELYLDFMQIPPRICMPKSKEKRCLLYVLQHLIKICTQVINIFLKRLPVK